MGLRVAFPGDRTIDNEGESFVLRTDDMVIWGEQTGGATPYNLFLASLGMCSGMELLAFCSTRGLPTDDVRLQLTPRFDDEGLRVTEIQVGIELPVTFPERFVEPCRRAVAQCNVKRHLDEPPSVIVSTVGPTSEGTSG